MIKYIKMKLFYFQMKRSIFEMFEHGEDVINFITNLAISCKDMTGDDLRKEVIHEISVLAHEQAVKEKEEEKAMAK